MNLLKYITTSIAIASLTAILAGCGGSSNTPERVVKKQISAIKNWDMKALAEVLVKSISEEIPATLDESQSKRLVARVASIPGETKKEIMAAASHIKIISSEIDGNAAIVVVSVPRGIPGEDGFDSTDVKKEKLELFMENGKWRIKAW
jgi:hypothetical protein